MVLTKQEVALGVLTASGVLLFPSLLRGEAKERTYKMLTSIFAYLSVYEFPCYLLSQSNSTSVMLVSP